MRNAQPRFWRQTVLPALMLIIALAAPGLTPSGLAGQLADGEDRDSLPVLAQQGPRVPEPLPPAWSISLSTEAGQPGTQVQVIGSNWWAGKAVELHWGSSDGPLLGEASPGVERSPSPGAFTLTFTVPDVPAGVYDVWAVGGEPALAPPGAGPGRFPAGGPQAIGGPGGQVDLATVHTQFVVVGSQPDAAPLAP